MESLDRRALVHIAGMRHNGEGVESMPWLKNSSELFFRRSSGGGINLFFFEMGDGTESYRQAFVEFSRSMPFVEAHLQADVWISSNHTRIHSPERLQHLVRRAVLDPDDPFVYRQLVVLDELRGQIVNLQVDHEAYPNEIAQRNKARYEEGKHDANVAARFILGGRVRQAPSAYYQSLIKEAALSQDRHKAVGLRVKDYVLGTENPTSPVNIYINFGSGHVKGLQRTIGTVLKDAGVNHLITTSYAAGQLYSHRYNLINRLKEKPNFRPEDRELITALLEQLFVDSPMLQGHPLIDSLQFTQRVRLIYTAFDQLSQKDLDRIVALVSKEGPGQALTKLVQARPYTT